MNQGRIWCVVSPNVGLPLLLGSVAATSLIVHACVLTHTSWMDAYWSGSWRNKSAATTPPQRTSEATPSAAPAFAVTVTPVAGADGTAATSFVVLVTPNPSAQPSAPGQLALAAPPPQ